MSGTKIDRTLCLTKPSVFEWYKTSKGKYRIRYTWMNERCNFHNRVEFDSLIDLFKWFGEGYCQVDYWIFTNEWVIEFVNRARRNNVNGSGKLPQIQHGMGWNDLKWRIREWVSENRQTNKSLYTK